MLSIVSERREKTWQHLESKIPDDFAASIDKPCVNTDKNTVAEEQAWARRVNDDKEQEKGKNNAVQDYPALA